MRLFSETLKYLFRSRLYSYDEQQIPVSCTYVSFPAAGLFSRGRLRGPAGLRSACAVRSKSRELAHFDGIAFRLARTKQDDGNPHEKNETDLL